MRSARSWLNCPRKEFPGCSKRASDLSFGNRVCSGGGMPGRVLFDNSTDPTIIPAMASPLMPDLVMRTPPNWTAVGFFAALGLLHLAIWAIAIGNHHTEGDMSLGFGLAFVLIATEGC